MNVKTGWFTIAGVGRVFIRDYDAASLTARVMAGGKFVDLKWNGTAWVLA